MFLEQEECGGKSFAIRLRKSHCTTLQFTPHKPLKQNLHPLTNDFKAIRAL